ncbi:MAG TPA: MBL fold metallo-hydrolase [Terriglobales bacterium]|nr:MBL fold metallo-hydrolase [Terriglobales bacterium]
MSSSRDWKWLWLFAVLLGSLVARAEEKRTVTKIADGVYAIEHATGAHMMRSGNTTVVIGERQVLVVDTCFEQSAAREDIAQIRQWTDKPVAFVLNTHFHNDHNLGNRAYMTAFPAVTIVAHTETKKSMDMYGPGSLRRELKSIESLQKMLETGKDSAGTALTDEDRTLVKSIIAARQPAIDELKQVQFQSATLTFDSDLTIDLGNREVQIKYLGKGNTAGDAIAYLPKEKILVAGDLVAYPTPNTFDGYPSEWVDTMDRLAALDADTIVPGHGPVMHDKKYLLLVRDLLKSARDQVNATLSAIGPPMFSGFDGVKSAVDLSAFRERFAGNDKNQGERFDAVAAALVKLLFEEAGLR